MKKTILLITLILTISNPLGAQNTLTMEDCMRYAVENSYVSKRAANNVLVSRANYTQAIGNHLPSLGASVGASGNFGRGIDPATNTYVNTATFNNSYGLNASLSIFRAGALINNTLNAKLAKARSMSELQKAKDDIALQVMATYIDALYNIGLVNLTELRVATFATDLHRAERMSELGTKSMADVAQFAATLASEELQLVNRSNAMDQSLLELKDMMNFPIDDTLNIESKSFKPLPTPSFSSAGAIFEAAASYLPSIDVLHKKLREQERDLAIARSSYYPSISASGGVSTNYFTQLTGIRNKGIGFGKQFVDNMGEYVSVNLSVPIFNGLQTRMSVRRAKIAFEQAKNDYNEQMRALRIDIERAVMDLESAQSQVTQADKSVSASRLAMMAAQRKYEEGMIDVIELHTASNLLLMAQIELLSAKLRLEVKSRQVSYFQGEPLLH